MASKNNKQDVSAGQGSMLSTPFACIAVQMALKAAIELNVFDILADSGPPGTQLSAPQIASKIPNINPASNQSVTSLYRILRFLSSNSFLTTSFPLGSTNDVHDRLFGLTPLTANTLTRIDGAALPISAVFLLFRSQKEIVQSYDMLKCAVLSPEGSDSTCPFKMVHGVGMYDYISQRPDSLLNKLFKQLMGSTTEYILDSAVKLYKGFNEVVELMDVGGNNGTSLEFLMSIYPNIQGGINFDLPHVIAGAPPLKGVKHVAGDMFEALPDAKTIMLKWILHNWSDKECVKLLQNCWRALPEDGGKVLVVEMVIPDDLETSMDTAAVITMDISMLVLFQGGKERTVTEFRCLADAAGFNDVNVVPIEKGFHLLEFSKGSN